MLYHLTFSQFLLSMDSQIHFLILFMHFITRTRPSFSFHLMTNPLFGNSMLNKYDIKVFLFWNDFCYKCCILEPSFNRFTFFRVSLKLIKQIQFSKFYQYFLNSNEHFLHSTFLFSHSSLCYVL